MGRFGSDPPPANVQAAKVAQEATALLGGKLAASLARGQMWRDTWRLLMRAMDWEMAKVLACNDAMCSEPFMWQV